MPTFCRLALAEALGFDAERVGQRQVYEPIFAQLRVCCLTALCLVARRYQRGGGPAQHALGQQQVLVAGNIVFEQTVYHHHRFAKRLALLAHRGEAQGPAWATTFSESRDTERQAAQVQS